MTAAESLEILRRTQDFERDWWRHDPGVAAQEQQRPGLRSRLSALNSEPVTTADVYVDEQDRWVSDRASTVHSEIAAAMLGDAVERPTVYFTVGCMGAGKTRVLGPLVESARVIRGNRGVASRVAADEVRMLMPEYHSGLGSRVVASEAFAITYDVVFPAALDRGGDIVYDTIGRLRSANEVSFSHQLEALRSAEYRVDVLLASAPLDLCIQRAAQRAAAEDGRYVDPMVQQEQYHEPAAVLRLLKDRQLCDDWAEVDTAGSADEPSLIEGSVWWRDNFAAVVAEVGRLARQRAV